MAISVTTHGQYLTQIEKSTILFPINCYLVREDDGLTLVDTNWTKTADAILAAAKQLGAPIRRIALTHVHGDHVGSLDPLHQALPDADVLVGVREARLLARDFSLDAEEAQTKPRGDYPVIATRPTGMLQPGDMVGSLRVIASPGHTPGHIAFLDTRDGTLIAGDALFTYTGIGVAGMFRLRFPFSSMATWDKATSLRTARALAELQPSRLAVGHGPVLEAPVAAMKQAIDSAAQRFPNEGVRDSSVMGNAGMA
jgi:glyoxylase-like metal-dependent hydrolase (beta-lactamase superfamily II)